MKFKILLFLFSLGILSSCGKKADEPRAARAEVTPEGTYSTFLLPVNNKLAPKISGKATISKYGDEFKVKITLKNAPKGVHRQYLHVGRNCPNGSLDINNDGFIDGQEASTNLGTPVLALDGDLSTDELGSDGFPRDSYNYSTTTSYSLMASNLGLSQRDLPLESRAVVVYGVPPTVALPASVSAKNNLGTHDGMPIACGILKLTYGGVEEDWDEDVENDPPPSRPRPRPRPRPDVDSEPPRPPLPPPDQDPPSWWERMRDRWNNWRWRMRCRVFGCEEGQ